MKVKELYVETAMDRENIEALKSFQPLLLIGSRGTGKTMLMRKAESELTDDFAEKSDGSLRCVCIIGVDTGVLWTGWLLFGVTKLEKL